MRDGFSGRTPGGATPGANLPGVHALRVLAEAPSRAGAPHAGEERAAASLDYRVGAWRSS